MDKRDIFIYSSENCGFSLEKICASEYLNEISSIHTDIFLSITQTKMFRVPLQIGHDALFK